MKFRIIAMVLLLIALGVAYFLVNDGGRTSHPERQSAPGIRLQ
jgi:uncharacterized membrane protein (DUF373 family)